MLKAVAAVGLTIVALYMILTFKTAPAATTAARPSTPARTAAPTAVAAPPPTPTPQTTTRTVDGPVAWNQWGPVQVAVTLSGTTITNVTALQMPMDHARSVYISQTVAPMLRSEVLRAQSANIDVISGATLTTEAYAQSLQAALDAARA